MTSNQDPRARSRNPVIEDWLKRASAGDSSVDLAELHELAKSPRGTVDAVVEVVMELVDRLEDDRWIQPIADGPLRRADAHWNGAVVERLSYFEPGEPRIVRLLGFLRPDPTGPAVIPPSMAERLSPELRELSGDNPRWFDAWREFEEDLDGDQQVD